MPLPGGTQVFNGQNADVAAGAAVVGGNSNQVSDNSISSIPQRQKRSHVFWGNPGTATINVFGSIDGVNWFTKADWTNLAGAGAGKVILIETDTPAQFWTHSLAGSNGATLLNSAIYS